MARVGRARWQLPLFCPESVPSVFTRLCLVLLETLGSSQAQSESLHDGKLLHHGPSVCCCSSDFPSTQISSLGFSPFPSCLSHGMFQGFPSLHDLTRQCPIQIPTQFPPQPPSPGHTGHSGCLSFHRTYHSSCGHKPPSLECSILKFLLFNFAFLFHISA